MSHSALDPAALVSLLPTLLPQSDKALKNQYDALTSLLHTAMSALAFRLTAVDESSSSIYENNVLPVEWNISGPGHYTLKYKHEQSSLEFVIKVSRLGSRTLINAIALETDKVATLDIATEDFTSPSFFPHNVGSANAQPLIHAFISSNRVTDLMSQFKLKILQKIMPGLRKEGYTEDTGESTASGPQPRAPPPPEAPPINPFQPPSVFPNNPLEIGRRDLDPFATNPFAPPSLFPPGSNGDGMFVGPNHPIFGAPRGPGGILPRGPWGGDGFLPPMGAPPGARFDPVGPEPYPRRGGPPGFPSRGRGGQGPASGEPDNDEFMPPGAVSF
ncbi:Proteasome inhibitor PI31 subunit [Leucoagaricus sp. SymC.cos]|nr:Proteasome inhibitor PI31 subunit [Leucoagaricus sp. SymC.cos]